MINERYQILELIGSGSMGTVYRVNDRRTGTVLALKRVVPITVGGLPISHEEAEEDRLALKSEFQVLASLNHPHIIRVFECGFDENAQPFYTMEYLQGESILAYGQEQPLPVKLDLLQQLFAALAYLHQRDILQRDLKPDNVLVVQGQVKLADFGLAACQAYVSPAATNLQGTAAYMSPELLKGELPTRAADLYAGGVIAYELLAGRHPFDVRNMNRLILGILHEDPDLSRLPEDGELRALVGALCAREPEQRPLKASDVVEAWLKIGQRLEMTAS
jgi:serine/threonine protein kinase